MIHRPNFDVVLSIHLRLQNLVINGELLFFSDWCLPVLQPVEVLHHSGSLQVPGGLLALDLQL